MQSARFRRIRGVEAFFGAWLALTASLVLAQTPIPSDISVQFLASPDTDLGTGQLIDFTLSATNLGPEAVQQEALFSSDVYLHELEFVKVVSCANLAGVTGNGVGPPFFSLHWYLTLDKPLGVGETRTCTFRFSLGSAAPARYEFRFATSGNYPDINPDNDSASVFLRRRVETIPLLSPFNRVLLALALAALASRTMIRRRLI
jgi:hypothetical protein